MNICMKEFGSELEFDFFNLCKPGRAPMLHTKAIGLLVLKKIFYLKCFYHIWAWWPT